MTMMLKSKAMGETGKEYNQTQVDKTSSKYLKHLFSIGNVHQFFQKNYQLVAQKVAMVAKVTRSFQKSVLSFQLQMANRQVGNQ